MSSVIPSGVYFASVGSKLLPNDCVSLVLTIKDGEYAGRQLFDFMHIRHPRAEAAKIAIKRLCAVYNAVGIVPYGPTKLDGQTVKITVGQFGAEDPVNIITRYETAGA